MGGKYIRAEHEYVSGQIDDVLIAVGDKPVFIELHNLVEMLEVNLIDKYFREVFNDKPTDGIATLIQYHAIRLYDFSKLLDKAVRKTKRKKDEQLPAAESDPPHWIPCAERLPEASGAYLVTCANGNVRVGHFATFDGKWTDAKAVAWMPLPEAYEGGDGHGEK